MKKFDIEGVTKLLAQPKSIGIVTHKNPDGDAMGATLALKHLLTALGHHTTVVIPNECPDFLKWLPGFETVVNFETQPEIGLSVLKQAEVIFTLDFNALHRTGENLSAVLENIKGIKIMIDHHQEPEAYPHFAYSDVSMSSTCEMVYHFITLLNFNHLISKEIATCIYTGIMTDTGSFKFHNTTSTTHKVVAALIDKGADNTAIHNAVFDSNSYQRFQLLGKVLQNLKVLEAYATAYTSLSQAELDLHHHQKGDTEGFVNYALSIKGIKFAAIFIENASEQLIKISLRSKGNFSVNTFSRSHFNGGGHTNAAGGYSKSTLEETIKYFLNILPQYKAELT